MSSDIHAEVSLTGAASQIDEPVDTIDAPDVPLSAVAHDISLHTPRPAPSWTRFQERPTIWGLSLDQLHERYWAARGVQVVRPGEKSEPMAGAELYLLTEGTVMPLFRTRSLADMLSWRKGDILWVRVREERQSEYCKEIAAADKDGEFRRFVRVYGASSSSQSRVALTPSIEIARCWHRMRGVPKPWRLLRQGIRRDRRSVVVVAGNVYDGASDAEAMQFMLSLVKDWQQPGMTISRAQKTEAGVWRDIEAEVEPNTTFLGPAWIGTGRKVADGSTVVGPAILWDDTRHHGPPGSIPWKDLEATNAPQWRPRNDRSRPVYRFSKRAIDIALGLLALILVLPFFPLIALVIYLEDGLPVFFSHRREGKGGRKFACLKFRSMRCDAEMIKERFAHLDQADGPQFHIDDDPRLTRVGRSLRRFHLDELPQLLNVLAGHMSIVGPRPSPYEENQFCPTWREARLSVCPGMTGLWQVKRTRQPGADFQEWIQYDIEYVDTAGVRLDLWIIFRTITLLLFGR